MRAFVAVADELHFRRAALRLNIVQPAVSAQIRALEEIVGVQLLHRNKRSVALTEPGRLFLAEVKRVLGQLDRAVDTAQRAGRGEAGTLVIGYSAATAHSGLLSRLVGTFHRALPAVALTVREMHPAVQRQALKNGELDVGLVVSDAETQGAEFVSRIVERWSLCLVLPADHALARLTRVPLDELRDEPFVSYAAHGEDLGVDAFRAAAGFAPNVVHFAQNPMMLLSLVGAGLGFATVPSSMRNIALPGVTFAQSDRAFPELPIAAVALATNAKPTLARFLELLQEP